MADPWVISHSPESTPLSLVAKVPRRRVRKVRRVRNLEKRWERKLKRKLKRRLKRKNLRGWTSLYKRNLLLLPREQKRRRLHKLYFYSCVNKVLVPDFFLVHQRSILSTLLPYMNMTELNSRMTFFLMSVQVCVHTVLRVHRLTLFRKCLIIISAHI